MTDDEVHRRPFQIYPDRPPLSSGVPPAAVFGINEQWTQIFVSFKALRWLIKNFGFPNVDLLLAVWRGAPQVMLMDEYNRPPVCCMVSIQMHGAMLTGVKPLILKSKL